MRRETGWGVWLVLNFSKYVDMKATSTRRAVNEGNMLVQYLCIFGPQSVSIAPVSKPYLLPSQEGGRCPPVAREARRTFEALGDNRVGRGVFPLP